MLEQISQPNMIHAVNQKEQQSFVRRHRVGLVFAALVVTGIFIATTPSLIVRGSILTAISSMFLLAGVFLRHELFVKRLGIAMLGLCGLGFGLLLVAEGIGLNWATPSFHATLYRWFRGCGVISIILVWLAKFQT